MSVKDGKALGMENPEQLRIRVLFSYLYMLLWICLSATVIMFNKYVLCFANFGFPITLTTIHMGVCSVLSFLLVKVGVVQPIDMNAEMYLRCIVPIGALFAAVLWLGNAAYLSLTVSFIQMLKASMPLTVFGVGILFGTESYAHKTAFNMGIVGTGIAIAAIGELNFVAVGVMLQIASIVAESVRITLIQILLQKRGIKLNPITSLYYIAPCCFACLLIPLYVLEYQPLKQANLDFVAFFPLLATNAAAAFALNLSVFLLIGKTSALTMNVAGVIKDWLLILLSVVVYKSPVTATNLIGYGIAFSGVCWYNKRKLEAMKQVAETRSKYPEKGKDMEAGDEETIPLKPQKS